MKLTGLCSLRPRAPDAPAAGVRATSAIRLVLVSFLSLLLSSSFFRFLYERSSSEDDRQNGNAMVTFAGRKR